VAISERKYQRLFEEAQADAIRFRQERDAALGNIRVIGRVLEELNPRNYDQADVERVNNGSIQGIMMARAAIAGCLEPHEDTARLDAIERARAGIECSAFNCVWHVRAVVGGYHSSADSLRGAIDKLIAAFGVPEVGRV
jgi:hypothetical protein